MGDTDLVERTINFIIFVALALYLFSGRLVSVLNRRRDGIADRIAEVHDLVRTTESKRENARARLSEARVRARQILSDARNEASSLVKQIEDDTRSQIDSLIRSNEEAMEFERCRMERLVVSEVIDELSSRVHSFGPADCLRVIVREIDRCEK